jgi:hypothetical protein
MGFPNFPFLVDRPWLHPLILWLRMATNADNPVADPGASGAIPVTQSGVVAITTAGAETRTLADPTFVGQRLTLVGSAITTSVAITAAHRVNAAGNTVMTIATTGKFLELECIPIGATLRWAIVANDGATLA